MDGQPGHPRFRPRRIRKRRSKHPKQVPHQFHEHLQVPYAYRRLKVAESSPSIPSIPPRGAGALNGVGSFMLIRGVGALDVGRWMDSHRPDIDPTSSNVATGVFSVLYKGQVTVQPVNQTR